MNDVEYFGRVHQNPPSVDANRHPYFGGKRPEKEVKPPPVVHEEIRVRDPEFMDNVDDQ
ncbi:hypothetical protein [Polynucleobacter antarcticus]|uniref:hypothetical protein n=1 Tax=Polynucleobacter antarcticus TaxID=1743162 RepID=UPI00156E0DBB|nr:hypothetical protein [Polynucleobacter antarcticus]